MSSLYYSCSPYLKNSRSKKSFFRKKSSSGVFGGGSGYRTSHNKHEFAALGKKASKNIAFGLARTGEAVKEGTATMAKAVEVARNIKSGKIKFEIGPAALIFGMVVISVSLSLLYLAHYNAVATKGYDLRRLEADRQQLMTQYDIKNMKLAEAKALATIASSEKAGSMRRASGIEFVEGGTAIASR